MSTLSVGKLATQAGVGIDTVRYYERAGLLPEPPRRASGYRAYPPSAVDRLRFIRRAKDLGFTLDEISNLLDVSDHRGDVESVKQLAQSRLDEIDRKLKELQRIRAALAQLTEACPGHGDAGACPILAALTGSDES